MQGQNAAAMCPQPQAERHIREFRTLYDVGQSLCAIHDLDRLLQCAMEQIVSLLGVESAAILLLDREKQELYFRTADASRPGVAQRLREIRFPADQGIAGWVVREGRSTFVADAEQDPRFYSGVDAMTEVRTRSYLCVPLKTRGEIIGVLTAVNKRSRLFDGDDTRIAEVFANQLATAIENARLVEELTRARKQLHEEPLSSRAEVEEEVRFPSIVGESAAMREVYRLVGRVLDTSTTVLLTGESGTGKERIAQAIHTHGTRAKRPFITVNCAAIPDTLLEAELFGYERGAFTGAMQRKPGRFELAGGGTLFLDEIGEMSPALQAKLLRVLQEKQFERLGGTGTITTDARIIAATNRDLEKLIAEGKFREDLFYRLNVYPIPLPPLRERREDILPLTTHFLGKYGKELRKGGVTLTKEARELVLQYPWPGNIRELENVIERAVILCQDAKVTAQELPSRLSERLQGSSKSEVMSFVSVGHITLAELEKQCILQALERAQYNRQQACRLLGLSRTQLRTRMRNHGLEEPPTRSQTGREKLSHVTVVEIPPASMSERTCSYPLHPVKVVHMPLTGEPMRGVGS